MLKTKVEIEIREDSCNGAHLVLKAENIIILHSPPPNGHYWEKVKYDFLFQTASLKYHFLYVKLWLYCLMTFATGGATAQ